MPSLRRALRTRAIVCIGAGAALLAGYVSARPLLSPPPQPWELPAVAAALFICVGVTLAFTLRALLHQTLREAQAQVDALLEKPSAPVPEPALRELAPLHDRLENVRAGYVRSVKNLARQSEELAVLQREYRGTQALLQSMLGRVDEEEGQSHTEIHRGMGPAHELVARLSPNLQWLAATAGLQHFLGAGIAELKGRTFLESVHPNDSQSVVGAFRTIQEKGEGHNIQFRLVSRDGQQMHVQMDGLARYTEQKQVLHFRCHLLDVTDRVVTESQLRRRTDELSLANERLHQTNQDLERLKEGYRDLYHHSPVMYFSLNAHGHVVTCNETMLHSLGYSREELTGCPYPRLLAPESKQRFQGERDIFMRPEGAELEAQWLKKDGQVIDVAIKSTPLYDEAGRFLRSRSVAEDITAANQLAAELHEQSERIRKVNEDLLRINRELDDFTYVVSHDLKEPLRTIEAFSGMLVQDYGNRLDAEAKEYLSYLVQASQRMGRLIDDLLNLSRAGSTIKALQICDVEELLLLVRSDLSDLIQRKNATLRIEGILPGVMADPERLHQLLANLISNGLKYNQSATPEVVVGQVEPRDADEQDTVTLYVRDNGIGIDPKYHDQIFKIFRRLHRREDYEGTGAGLAICRKIIEAHGGRIWVESQLGQGATFCFTMPRAEIGEAGERRTAPPADEPAVTAADVGGGI